MKNTTKMGILGIGIASAIGLGINRRKHQLITDPLNYDIFPDTMEETVLTSSAITGITSAQVQSIIDGNIAITINTGNIVPIAKPIAIPPPRNEQFNRPSPQHPISNFNIKVIQVGTTVNPNYGATNGIPNAYLYELGSIQHLFTTWPNPNEIFMTIYKPSKVDQKILVQTEINSVPSYATPTISGASRINLDYRVDYGSYTGDASTADGSNGVYYLFWQRIIAYHIPYHDIRMRSLCGRPYTMELWMQY